MRPWPLAIALSVCSCALRTEGTAIDEAPGVEVGAEDSSSDSTIAPGEDVGAETVPEDFGTDAAVDSTIATEAGIDASADTTDDARDSATDTRDAAPDAAPCVPVPTTKLCTEIEHLESLATAQVLDGTPDEFCGASYYEFDNSSGESTDPSPVPIEAKTIVKTRVAWSTFGLHLHLAVADPMLWTHADPQYIWQGDSVELYVAGFATLTGRFDATNDVGAMQVVLTPVANALPARAEIFFAGARQGSLPTEQWKIRNVATGYEVEVRIPWAFIGGTAIAAGKSIGFTMAVNQKWNTTIRHTFSLWKQKVINSSPCPGGVGNAYCDDRTWCTPKLL